MRTIPQSWKVKIARLFRQRPFGRLLSWAVQIAAPRRRVGVIVVVFNEAGQILLLRHVLHPVYPWGLPGGWLERGEAPADGALRELREETGLTAIIDGILCINHGRSPDHLAIAYSATAPSGPITVSAEIIEARWCAVGDYPGNLLPFHVEAIETAVARRRANSIGEEELAIL